MALLQNGYRDASSGVRIFGATASNVTVPYALLGNTDRAALKRNITAGEGYDDGTVGLAYGYRNEYAWVQPLKPGGLKSVNEAEGSASLAASIAGGKNGEASIAGVGSMTGTGALVVSATATIAGVGALSANILAALIATGSSAGVGSLTATATAKGYMEASPAGVGSMSVTSYATGTMEADITPFTELSPQSLAESVWGQILDAGFTAEEMMRVMTAVLAGEVSGAGTATITIRDIGDTKTRVSATVDGTGNRTAVTLDAT
jgi:hypothetical protein